MDFQFKLGPTEIIRATVTEESIKSPPMLSIRMWWYLEDDKNWVPTGKGFTIPIGRAEEFVEALYTWFGVECGKLIAKALREQSDEDEDERPVRRATRTKKTARSRREEPAPRTRTKRSARR